MFFSPDLLAKRDSGFGLLWLAATLGSKSVFKKIPKRSVLTADITRLCDLIAEPVEPLALRLSSNLMFGVVRVYKVKQEIFMTDVTNCVTSLKKVVQEFKSTAAPDTQLQMVQPNVRSSALTLVPDPRAAYTIDFDALVADWDEYLNITRNMSKGAADDGDDIMDDDADFNPKGDKANAKVKAKPAPPAETVRREIHTLTEHHDHLLSASFDLSFNGSGPEFPGPSSSLVEPEAAFNDNLFALSDGLDLAGGLGDDFARELGWGGYSPAKTAQVNPNIDMNFGAIDNDINMDFGFNDEHIVRAQDNHGIADPGILAQLTPMKRKFPSGSDKENHPPSAFLAQATPNHAQSPAISFSRLLLSQDEELPVGLNEPASEQQGRGIHENARKKTKRIRLLLDARTELTDEELKVARAQYLEAQNKLRRHIVRKKSEKESGRIIEELVWGVPQGIQAQILVDFWQENFKVQVEARSGALYIHHEEPPQKRRRTSRAQDHRSPSVCLDEAYEPPADAGMDWDMGIEGGPFDVENQAYEHRGSSEEPGQARRMSRSASVLGGSAFGFEQAPQNWPNGSQRSSLFPWDNAGPSSSSGGAPAGFPGSDDVNLVDRAEVRLRGSSQRRDNSLVPSQIGSLLGGPGLSPAVGGGGSQLIGEDYVFDVGNDSFQEDKQESQRSDMNLITLERNSFNFLEYAKMQHQTLSKPAQLTFDLVVPKRTSTRHVASAAFYHCLVLATKDLVRLEQPDAHGTIFIAMK